MSEADFVELLDASKPTVCIKIGDYVPASPQENANRAWRKLGDKMGFMWDTVQPIPGQPPRFFSAVPKETPEAQTARLKHEADDKRGLEINHLRSQIERLQCKLSELEKEEASQCA